MLETIRFPVNKERMAGYESPNVFLETKGRSSGVPAGKTHKRRGATPARKGGNPC